MKKKENSALNLNLTKKTKLHTEPSELYSNHSQAFVFKNTDLEDEELKQNKYGPIEGLSNNVSPTFNATHTVSLKHQHFRNQNLNYSNLYQNQKDIKENQMHCKQCSLLRGANLKMEDRCKALEEKVKVQDQQLKEANNTINYKLQEHYKQYPFFQMLMDMLTESDRKIQLVLEFEHTWKQSIILQEEKESFESKINQLQTTITCLQNTSNKSISACKKCISLSEKEKENAENYEKVKKLTEKLSAEREERQSLQQKMQSVSSDLSSLKALHEEVQRKRKQLMKEGENYLTKQCELQAEIQKMKKQEENRSFMHVELEQMKENQHQNEKKHAKIEEKYKRDLNQLKEQLEATEDFKQDLENQKNKLKQQLAQLQVKELHSQHSNTLQSQLIQELSTNIETLQQDALKLQRNIEGKSAESKSLQEQLNHKKQQLTFIVNAQTQKELQGAEIEKKLKAQQLKTIQIESQLQNYLEMNQVLESKIHKLEEGECRIKENFSSLTHFKQNKNDKKDSNLAFNSKSKKKIKQIWNLLKNFNQENQECLKKIKMEVSEEDFSVNDAQVERILNQIFNEMAGIINKFGYFKKDNQILIVKVKHLQEEAEERITATKIYQQLLEAKDLAIKSILSFIPEQFKTDARDLLYEIDCILENDQDSDKIEDLCRIIESGGKEWKEVIRKMEEEREDWKERVRRVEDERKELEKRLRLREGMSRQETEMFEPRERISRKDHKRKYEF